MNEEEIEAALDKAIEKLQAVRAKVAEEGAVLMIVEVIDDVADLLDTITDGLVEAEPPVDPDTVKGGQG